MKKLLLILIIIASGQAHAQNWSLVWADEFNGTSLNLADWNHDLGTGSQYGLTGWGNNELQYYRSENVEVSGGNLKITALQENYMGMDYTSGKIHTKTKRFYTHGKIEARMQVPTDQGMWPAFWMLTDPGNLTQNAASWPPEIDIMETVGHTGNTTFATAHYGNWPAVISDGGNYAVPSGDLSSAFHTYSIEWYPDNIAWYFDGILIHELNALDVSPEAWQFNQDFFLIFNLAVGGPWPGSPDGTTTFPEEMLVDWVRVYEYDDTVTTDVTFRVDMSDQILAPTDIVHVNGTWNTWCGICNPMTDMGNGVWEVTLPIPPGVHEYKFTTNGWVGLQEDFSGGESCTITTFDGVNTYINRVLNVQFDPISLAAVCFDSCSVCPGSITDGCTDSLAVNYISSAITDDGSCVYDVTFVLDLNAYAGVSSNPEVHADFNGWCQGCDLMTDTDLDDVWEVTLQLPIGNYQYLYSLDLQTDLEDFAPSDPCVVGSEPFLNRELIVSGVTILDVNCWNSCDPCATNPGCMDSDAANYDSSASSDDGSCLYDVTFHVDMNNYGTAGVDYTTPEVNGGFNGWCGSACNPMSDPESDGIWTTTISLSPGNQEYKFAVDNWTDQEYPAGSCMLGANRLAVVTGVMDLGVVCWGSCSDCPIAGCTDPVYLEFDPFAELEDGSCATLAVYGCMYSAATNYDTTANVDDGSCSFNCTDPCLGDFDGNLVVNTADILAFLTFFGTICD